MKNDSRPPRNLDHRGFKHGEITQKIIGIFFDVYNELGHGFLESVYGKSLEFALNSAGLEARRKIEVPVIFGDKVLETSKPICSLRIKFSWN